MALITACPACQTQFEVTEPDLQAYGGKVRCGECAHVFDARSYLLPSSATNATTPNSTVTNDDRLQLTRLKRQADEHVLHVPEIITDAGDGLAFSIKAVEQSTEDLSKIPDFLRNITVAEEMRSATPKPWKQALLIGATLGLGCLLTLQTFYFCRTAIAANYPASRPAVQSLCKHLHCTVELPQDITQLTIDDADMQEHPQREGALIFSCALMNHGYTAQAWPNIEITLTNTADEPVIRKRLKPNDYVRSGQTNSEGIAAQEELHVNVLLAVKETHVAGFRVALDY